MLEGADAQYVANAVMRCPTGALTFERIDGAPQEPVPEETAVQPRPDGPLFLRGKIRITDRNGTVTREATRCALCRCGESGNKPFCDGTHRAVGFRAP